MTPHSQNDERRLYAGVFFTISRQFHDCDVLHLVLVTRRTLMNFNTDISAGLYGLLIISMLLLPLQGHTQNQLSLGTLAPGQIALNLNLTEQKEVDQDTLNASLVFTVQGRNQTALQNEVNEAIAGAIKLLQDSSEVDFTTGRYRVSMVPTERPSRNDIENPVWRAQQSMDLRSTNSDALLEMAGKLQESGMTMNGLYYSLSPSLHETVSAELLQSALEKLTGRAEAAARALGRNSAELVEVSMDGSPNFGQAYMPMEMSGAAMLRADFAPPQAEPGTSRVSVTISARAILSP